MKVQPQKKNQVNYPRLKDMGSVCKTAAALTLTASTLVGITACGKDVKAGTFNNTKVEVPKVTELDYAGGLAEMIPQYALNDNLSAFVDPMYATGTVCFDLENGDTLCVKDSTYYVISGVNIDEISEDSELYKDYNKDDFTYFQTYDGDIIIVHNTMADWYIDSMTLDGDVAYVGEWDD